MSRRRKTTSNADEDEKLWPGRSEALLKALHILTPDGRLNQDSRRKLKQVLHLYQLLKPALDTLYQREEAPLIIDLGAGKSYLGLILYDLDMGPRGRGRLAGIEARPELVAASQAIAAEAGFDRASFHAAAIASEDASAALQGERPGLVTALHACDTATDDAIRFALKHDAAFVALVPCCQAEAARLLEQAAGPLDSLWRFPIQRRAFGAHLTNVIRALYLESHGYRVRVTEFTGFEHTLKNELILAERIQRSNAMAKAQLEALLAQIPARIGLVA